MSWKIGMPNLGHTMDEGKVTEWLKTVGSRVSRGETIAIVESDKASFDIESPTDGTLIAIEVEAGSVVPVGATLGIVSEGTPAVAESQSKATGVILTQDKVPATALKPRVRVKAGSARQLVANDFTDAKLVTFWRDMNRIRAFEQAAVYQSSIGKIYGALHSCEGQESCCVGVCAALREDDYVASTHRGHGHSLAKGARMDRMMAELFGRADGYCGGKGGSLHITDLSVGMLGANGIVGAGYAIAAGAALHAKIAKNGKVAVVFFGDGAITRGTFHEVMNMASLWKLPLILVCENNGLAQYVYTQDTMVFDNVALLAGNYKIIAQQIDGNDVRAVYNATSVAVDRARAGMGPTLLELKTQRFQGHSSGDPQVYRTRAEVDAIKLATDPIARLEVELLAAGILDDREAQLANVRKEVEEAVAFADASPYPQPEAVLEDVYA